MQRKMRTQFLAYAMPHLRIQSPSVQQHKMAISRTPGLPPDVIHQLLFSFSLKGCIYANSTGIVLAMPNAPDVRALGSAQSVRGQRANTPAYALNVDSLPLIPSFPVGAACKNRRRGSGWSPSATMFRR